MNQFAATTQSSFNTLSSNEANLIAQNEATTNTVNTRYRERDFGVGYGSSSGYASRRSYVETQVQSFFRCC